MDQIISYKPILDSVDCALGVFEADRLVTCNQNLIRLFGCKASKITGKTLSELSPELQNDGIQSSDKSKEIFDLITAHGSHTFSWCFKSESNDVFTADVSFNSTKIASTPVILATITPSPTTSINRTSPTDENWTETVLHTIQSGIFIIDRDRHEIVDLNQTAAEMVGVKRTEILGRNRHTFTCQKARGNRPITDKERTLLSTESVLIRKNGSRIPILKTVSPTHLKGRECLIESFVDISALKRAEEEARIHQERFRTFFSSVNDAIFVHPLMKEGFAPFIEVNDIACDRYGYTRDEFVQLTAEDITKKVDVEKHAASSHRQKLLKDKHMFFETVHIKKSGETFPVEINSNIVEQHGQPIILAVVRDISERKQAEEDKVRIEAQYRQSQKVESIGRLAGGVAHDLNNMLLPIIGFSELLLRKELLDEQTKTFVQQIADAGQRAQDLVHQLLAFGRRQALDYKNISINEVIKELEGLLRQTLREDIQFDFLLEARDHLIKADNSQIGQVIMNLCTNAQDAMPEGGTLTVSTSILEINSKTREKNADTAHGTFIALSVKDSGCGMSKTVKEHIFEPFYSTKGDQSPGLGLSTVYGIVKQHNGDIWVTSEPGTGSEFVVYLPIAASSDSGDCSSSATHKKQ